MKENAVLSSYQLYAISKNDKLVKEIRNAAKNELNSRPLSIEECNVIAEKYKLLSNGSVKNRSATNLIFITLSLFLPIIIFFPSKIALCFWSCFFASFYEQYFKIQQRTLILYILFGFVFWTIIVIIADKYFL